MGYTSLGEQSNHADSDSTVWATLSISPSSKGQLLEMDYIDLAVEVLKTHNPHLIHSLTDFLMILPSPRQIQEVLQNAVDCLAQSDVNTHQWILENSSDLMPYLDLLSSEDSLSYHQPIDSTSSTSEYCP